MTFQIKESLDLIFDCITMYNTDISKLLIKSNAVIAGEFVLDFIIDKHEKSKSIDIYTPYISFGELFSFLKKEFKCVSILYITPINDKLLYELGVLIKISFVKSTDYQINLMILRPKQNPLDLIENMDLSFLSVWFDGININGKNVSDSIYKFGYLNKKYVNQIFNSDNSLRDKINKYKDIGFKINIETCEISDENTEMDTKLILMSKLFNGLFNCNLKLLLELPSLITDNFDTFINILNMVGKQHGVENFGTKCIIKYIDEIKYINYKMTQTISANEILDIISSNKPVANCYHEKETLSKLKYYSDLEDIGNFLSQRININIKDENISKDISEVFSYY